MLIYRGEPAVDLRYKYTVWQITQQSSSQRNKLFTRQGWPRHDQRRLVIYLQRELLRQLRRSRPQRCKTKEVKPEEEAGVQVSSSSYSNGWTGYSRHPFSSVQLQFGSVRIDLPGFRFRWVLSATRRACKSRQVVACLCGQTNKSTITFR